MTPAPLSEESDENEELDVPGKKSKTNPRNNQKSLNSKPTNKTSNYNNIMLIKNEQIVSNSSSLKQLKAQYHLAISLNSKALTPVTHQQLMLDEASITSAAERQQQNPSSTSTTSTPLGVSDRMSKEKQKFFRFSVFNSERKAKSVDGQSGQQSKSSLNNNKSKINNNNHKVTTNGIETGDASAGTFDKYKFVSSSDSEHDRDTICDKTKAKAKGKSVSVGKQETGRKSNHVKDKTKKDKVKSRNKQSASHLTSDDSSCCSSDGEDSGSSSDSSTSSTGTSTSSSGSSSSANSSCSSAGEGNQNSPSKASLANKAESINTMNVFACINSRELSSQTKRPPYCWTSMPFAKNQQSESLFKKQSTKSKSFGANNRSENEVWGFAAEAKKSLNIFTNSDSESRTHRMSNFSGTESDCQMSLLSLSSTNARNRISRSDRDAGSSRFTNQMPLLAPHLRKNMLSNNRTTLMRNNTIMSSDDDARQLSPSKMFRKAVNYKKFDNNTLNNKKLIMDTSLNGAKYGCDDRPVKEPDSDKGPVESSTEPTPKQSQPPYNNNTNNLSTDMGKKLKTLRL